MTIITHRIILVIQCQKKVFHSPVSHLVETMGICVVCCVGIEKLQRRAQGLLRGTLLHGEPVRWAHGR